MSLLSTGFDGGLDALSWQPELTGDGRDGPSMDATTLTLPQPQECPRTNADLAAPFGQSLGGDDVAQQVVKSFDVTRGHGAAEATANRQKKLRHHGEAADAPLILATMRPTARERFESMVSVEATGCWRWTGTILTSSGYGQFRVSVQRRMLAHRYAYEEFVGPIPEGLEVDHLCCKRWCCNPAHLEPVTPEENQRRAISAMRAKRGSSFPPATHCVKGHELNEANVRIYRGRRQCRACNREWRHIRAAREGRIMKSHGPHLGKTHCPHGHLYDEANSGRNRKGYRFCLACSRERRRRPTRGATAP